MSDSTDVATMIDKLEDQLKQCSAEDLVRAMHQMVLTEMSPKLRKALLKKMTMSLVIKVMKD